MKRSGRQDPSASYSPRLAGWFTAYVKRFFARNFHAVRTSGQPELAEGKPDGLQGPLIVYANHPSWWDPIHFLLLCSHVFPGRRVFGPMDAEALKKYAFFRRLGVFGVERDSLRGAASFLRHGQTILQSPEASLWLTVQGRFTDARERPLALQPGLAHLARRSAGAVIIPLAIEYPFWNERYPEALSRFGRPVDASEHRDLSVDEWNLLLAKRLEETMDRLATDVASRDPDRFHTLQSGSAGVGGVYDQWRRLRAWAKGQSFDAAHGERTP